MAATAPYGWTHLPPRAVAISISALTKGPGSSGAVRKLRKKLPGKVALVLGGDGAPRPSEGIRVVQYLRALEAWGHDLVAGRVR
mgnify:CR=1 FL=1